MEVVSQDEQQQKRKVIPQKMWKERRAREAKGGMIVKEWGGRRKTGKSEN